MSYHFKFSPRFIHHKREILSLTSTPSLVLPKEIEASLHSEQKIAPGGGPLWRECLRVVRPFLFKSALISVVVAFCATTATLCAMELLKSGKNIAVLVSFAIAYFVANVGAQIGNFFNNLMRNGASHAVHALLVSLISKKLLRLSSRAEARQTSGNLKVLITSDTLHVAEFVDNFVRNFIPAMVALVVVLPVLFHLTGKAGLTGVIIMIGFLPLSFGLNRISMHFQKKSQGALDSLATLLGEWVKNVRLIRYLSWEDTFQQEIILKLRRYMSHSTVQHLLACLIFGLSVSWWMVSVLGVFLVERWTHTPLDLIGFFGTLWLITFLASYFIHIPNTIRLYGQASPSIDRIAVLLAEEEQSDLFIKETEVSSPLDSKPIRVIFENVEFSYPTADPKTQGKTIIQSLSVILDLHRKVAIVGEVACGKTTFLKLLCGEFPPTQGQILVEFEDGQKLNLWKKSCHEAYRKHLAWVPQEPFISSDPLSANISLISTTEEAALVEAAYWAELEADILAFPRGIHEEIGEGGVNLSGGQKQRLNVARAYFSDRSYLVLDDSLSAVDSNTEVALMKRLETYQRGFTLVTHRTDELMRVEEVLVMKNGTFIERGDPKRLGAQVSSSFSRILRAYEQGNEVLYV